jgi:DNA-binding NarL/FixJ family response regulator
MKPKKAAEIMKSLVQGIDPASGEEIATDSVLQKAQVLRALLVAISAIEQNVAREARRALLPANVGTPWTPDEERRLVEAFQSGIALSDIAKELSRTVRAVEARLERLELLPPEQRTTRDSFG